jgi:hypothetical protein
MEKRMWACSPTSCCSRISMLIHPHHPPSAIIRRVAVCHSLLLGLCMSCVGVFRSLLTKSYPRCSNVFSEEGQKIRDQFDKNAKETNVAVSGSPTACSTPCTLYRLDSSVVHSTWMHCGMSLRVCVFVDAAILNAGRGEARPGGGGRGRKIVPP